jgi:hypothetical protein
MSRKRLLATAAGLVGAGAIAIVTATAAAAAGPVIAYNVSTSGHGAGYALFRDSQTHYRFATIAVKIPGTIPSGVLATVELFDQSQGDAAQIQLVCNGTTCTPTWNYTTGTFTYDNNIIGSNTTPGTALTGTTLSAGDTVLLKLYYNPSATVHTVIFGADDQTSGHSFTNGSRNVTHAEFFTEAGYGSTSPGSFTQAQENFYSSTGPAMPITVVAGLGGTGGLVRVDTTGGLSPDSTLSAANQGSFTLS